MNDQEKTKEELIIELEALQKKYDSLKEMSSADSCTTRDVQNEINESENIRFQKFIEHAPIAMAIVNMNGDIEFINHKAVNVFGYKHQDIPTMERWWTLAYPDEKYRNEVVADWMGRIQKALIENIEIVGNEYRVTCKDKTVKTVFIWGIPVSEKIFVLFDDITKRKQADEALHKIESEFSLVYNNTTERQALMEVSSDKKLRIISLNKSFIDGLQMAGIPVSKVKSVIGKYRVEALLELGFPLEIINAENTYFNRAIDTGTIVKHEQPIPIPNGMLYVINTFVPLINTNGICTHVLYTSQDITERKQVEQELIDAKLKVEESELSYRLLINSIPNTSILLFDKGFRYLIVGGNEIEKRGFDNSLIQGKTLYEAFPKEVVEIFEPLYLKVFNGESTAFERKYGDLTYFHQVIPIHNAEKEIFAGMVIAQNITATKQTQKAIIESHRLNAIGEMASSVAHDFNNSLQAMMGNIEVAKLETKIPDITLKYLDNIASIISDVAVRVKSLQRFGDTKRDSKDNKFINLNTIIEETLLQLHPLWKDNMQKAGMTISIKPDYGDIPEIYNNEGELKTAFHNIIKNSIEAMPEGGTIRIVTGKKNNGVYVTVEDSGVGMDEETKLKIFQPFFTTKGFDVGRGLGMSGVYCIMKDCGGDIVVKKTELGKGTTIELVFPLNEQEVRKEEKGIEEKVLKKEVAHRVLWVEDDALIRLSSGQMVESMGHKCDMASSGKNALKYLHKNSYDIVITDIGMPEMNGWQLADIIKEKFGGKIKVAVVSGWNVDEKEKTKHGVKWVLEKPFQIAELKKLLERCKEG